MCTGSCYGLRVAHTWYSSGESMSVTCHRPVLITRRPRKQRLESTRHDYAESSRSNPQRQHACESRLTANPPLYFANYDWRFTATTVPSFSCRPLRCPPPYQASKDLPRAQLSAAAHPV